MELSPPGRRPDPPTPDLEKTMTDQTEPIRKSSLPCTPPPEWEFHTWFPRPDGGGDMVRGERQRGVVVRRRVSYSDWEPVRPGRWAAEPETDAAVPAAATDRAALRDRIADVLAAADGWKWVTDRDKARSSTYRSYQSRADKVLAVLPATVDRAAVLLEAADAVPTAQIPFVSSTGRECVATWLRRLAEAQQDDMRAWQQEWDNRPDGADVSDLVEIKPVAREAQQEPTQDGETDRCGNCEGIDPDSCLFNPARAGSAAAPAKETPTAEDPARIDRLRPEFTEHASVESIDVQLTRARAQERRWHLRAEWLLGLRQARLEAKARGEWPAAAPAKETRTLPCSRAIARQPHGPHDWEPQPGMAPVHCPGTAETPGEVVHGCPPAGSSRTPCCGRTPWELPLGDRISSEAPVTCTDAPAKEA